MGDVLIVLFGLAIVLLVVTVVGHFFWLIAAAAWRAMSGGGRQAVTHDPRRCLTCGHPQGVSAGRCRFCQSLQTRAGNVTPIDELDATQRRLERLFQQGVISSDLMTQVSAALRGERHRLTGPSRRTDCQSVPQQHAPRAEQTAPEPRKPPVVARPISAPAPPVVEAAMVTPVPPVGGARPREREATTVAAQATDSAPTPRQPRRTFADLLQAFMEDRNIRWGELISGLLIVGSAIGLVVSLRHTLSEAIPYFPALLFMLVTAAIHAAGNYTLRRWKLRSTSRGVLLIGTLLVPLNFWAAIMMSGSGDSQLAIADPRYFVAVAVGVLSFGAMVYFASRALMRSGWWLMMIAVMGASIGQLFINRLGGTEMSAVEVTLLMLLPLACFVGAAVGQLVQARRWERMSAGRCQQVFTLLGVAAFALIGPFGLLLLRSSDVRLTLSHLSPALSVGAAMIVGMGLLVQQRTRTNSLAKVRMAGTWLAIMGGTIMFAALALAWPQPQAVIAVCAINVAALIALALLTRVAALHAGAIASASVGLLVGLHLVRGEFDLTNADLAEVYLRVLLTDVTSVALTVFAIAVGGIGVMLLRRGRIGEAANYLWGCAVSSGLGVAIAAIVGFRSWPYADGPLATTVLAANAIVLLVMGAHLRRSTITYVGAGLLWVALIHAFALNQPVLDALAGLSLDPAKPVLVATLLHAIAMSGLAIAAGWKTRKLGWLASAEGKSTNGAALTSAALVSSVAAVPFAVIVTSGQFAAHVGYALAIATVWLVVAVLRRSPRVFGAFQAMAALGISYVVCAASLHFTGWTGSLADVRIWPQLISVLAVWCLLWSGIRLRQSRSSGGVWWLDSAWTKCDQVVLGVIVVGIVVFCALATLPGIATEFGGAVPEHFVSLWQPAGGPAAWCAALLTTMAILLTMRTRSSNLLVAALMFALTALPLLVALQFESSLAIATALRWTFMLYGVVFAVAYCFRESLHRRIERSGWLGPRMLCAGPAQKFRHLGLLLSGAPIAVICLSAAVPKAFDQTFAGPLAGSFFADMGPIASYCIPGFVFMGVLLLLAVRDRSSGLALAGSGILQLTLTIALLIKPMLRGHGIDGELLIRLVQWNAVALAAYSSVWLMLRRRLETQRVAEPRLGAASPWSIQLAATLAVAGSLGLIAAIALFVSPTQSLLITIEVARPASFAATLAAAAVGLWSIRGRQTQWVMHLLGGLLLSITALAALAISWNQVEAGWLAYRFWMVSVLGVAILGTAVAFVAARSQRLTLANTGDVCARCAVVVGGLAVLLALRSCLLDPTIWWSVSVVAGAAVIATLLGLRGRQQWLGYCSAGLAAVATILACRTSEQTFLEILCLVLLSVLIVGGVWQAVEIRHQKRRGESFQTALWIPPLHQFIAVTVTAVFSIACVAALWLSPLLREVGVNTDDSRWIALVVLAALGCFLLTSLWDRRSKSAVGACYVWGITAMSVLLRLVTEAYPISWQGTLVIAGLMTAGYLALTGHLWKWGMNLARFGSRVGVPLTVARLERTSRWLPPLNLAIAGGLVILFFSVVLTFDARWMRYCAAAGPLLLAYATATLAQQERAGRMRLTTLLLLGLTLALAGWADITPAASAIVTLELAIRLLMALSVVTALYGAVVPRMPLLRTSQSRIDWLPATKRAAAGCGAAAIATLVAVLVMEAAFFEPGVGTPLSHGYQIVAVSIVLVGLVIALLSLALLRDKDPLSLSERGRTIYVYAAEIVAALLCGHLYLARPNWFDLPISPYWPYIVMAIAFVGVGAGELFRRLKLRVLAEPLERTAAFLPLLPVLAFWVLARDSQLAFAASGVSYSAVLVFAGLLYAALCILRKSFVSGLAAALAGNAALWMFFSDHRFSIIEHPQFWLIPPALSVLAAAQINRGRLDRNTLAGVRYACVSVIYLSSTVEMFIQSASQNLWPPMVLALFAVIGALAGILMRVRAFLYLGSAFVLLAIVSMVWHATRAIGEVWPWWVFGMGLGAALLVLFGVFEMKRNEVLRLLRQMRSWER